MRQAAMRIGAVAAVVAAFSAGQMLDADGVLDRDQRRLDRARETHAQEVDRARDIYETRVERANTALQRVYDQMISRYENRGERDLAQRLEAELKELVEAAAFPEPGSRSGDDDNGANAEAFDELLGLLGPELVRADGSRVDAAALRGADYVVLYYSAEWCAPCRLFTPQLLEVYRQSATGTFEVILVSSDRSEGQMLQYMQGAEMPWPAVPYDRIDASGLKDRFGRGAIPHVVLFDPAGEVVASSHTARPRQVLEELTRRIR